MRDFPEGFEPLSQLEVKALEASARPLSSAPFLKKRWPSTGKTPLPRFTTTRRAEPVLARPVGFALICRCSPQGGKESSAGKPFIFTCCPPALHCWPSTPDS